MAKARLEAGQVDVFTYTHSNWQVTDITFKLLWQAGWNVHDARDWASLHSQRRSLQPVALWRP
ncbi:hypothetical protein ETAA8_00990 [Anatilimnocola aggregata]|uniref:Uncharacterized protein n=1 Tax=Anatilimnocola aggregata TaxID=2528021 RepID=A0A517Y455_9BACT|nr:hypothetical protein [Anatilimnocola aggregata]QDU25038.1 hypothetical protein ETAA8_00990 [Anatilimnocola aggregata]